MSRFAYLALSFAFVLAGCLHTTSRTGDLRLVHETYRNDFAQIALDVPVNESGDIAKSDDQSPSFNKTLLSIREFRVKYKGQEGQLKKELAHLVVLEGMIYLQSAHFGSAAAMAPKVMEAGEQLTSDDKTVVRDRLFAVAFPHLISGWDQINREEVPDKTVDLRALERAADGIANMLKKTIDDDNNAPEIDSGGLYLATNAAIYWVWLHELYGRACKTPRAPCNTNAADEAEKAAAVEIKARVENKSYYKKACDLIARHLSSSERAAASVSFSQFPAGTSGRLRFLRWYAWFHEQRAC